MHLFINHSVENKDNEIIVTLYLDKRFGYEEFTEEFLSKNNKKKWSLENEAKHYLASYLPNFKGGVIKIALGTMILTTLPMTTFAQEVQENETEVVVENSSQNIAIDTNTENTSIASDNQNTVTKIYQDETIPPENNSINNELELNDIAGGNQGEQENQDTVLNSDTDTVDTSTESQENPEKKITLYTVQVGDNLTQISKKFNISIDQIKKSNNLISDTIFVDQVLELPVEDISNENVIIEENSKSETPVLNIGVHHHRVVQLKLDLEKLGFKVSNNPNDFYGSITAEKVKEFQRKYGLEITGVTDKTTLEAIDKVINGETLSIEAPLLKIGIYHPSVIQLKLDLEKLGFKVSNNPNEFYGSITANKVEDFQRKYGLKPTGVASPDTLLAIDKVIKGEPLNIKNQLLTIGVYHPSVIQLKLNLDKLGFKVSNNPNNFYGSITAEKVGDFQRKYRLEITGVADNNTLHAIDKLLNGETLNIGAPVLKNGINHPSVIQLKLNLERLGLKVSNNPNDFYGSITAERVKDFQRKYGLEITGIANEVTLNAIDKVINGEPLKIETPLLKIGVHHPSVTKLKLDLEKIGFRVSNNPNDFYGSITSDKVKEFQQQYNLVPDGIAGKETLDKLEEVLNEFIPSPFTRIMQLNSTGEDVRLLQTYLNDAGFHVVDQPTTHYGTLTKNQIIEFQRQQGLTPTGVADARTLQKLISTRESVVENISNFIISGRGYGHAVGMTQWGAYGMAEAGYPYEEILKYYYTGTGIGKRDTDNQNVRVLLTEKSTLLKISSNQAYQVGDKEFLPNTVTSIQYQNGEYVITNGSNTYKRTNPFQISSTSNGLLHFDNYQYEGTFYVSSTDNKLDLVNHLNVENYLKGVVPYEIIPSWDNLDLFKVQTLAARTYVLKEIQRHQNDKFDVYDTVRSQVYNGIPKEANIPTKYVNKINQAISETKGEVILYNGVLIDAVYSASAGGHTVDAVDVWGNNIPYLVGREDPYDTSVYNSTWWSYTITKQELQRIFPEVGNIINVKVINTKYNRPTEIEVIGEKQRITVTGTVFRQKIGTSNIKSNTFTIGGV